MAKNKYLPYFWEHKITPQRLKEILNSDDEGERNWAIARLLESAPLSEVWEYLSFDEIKLVFADLQLKKPVRKAWEKALKVWNKR